MSAPDPKAARCFRFVRRAFDVATSTAHLVYAFDDGPELIETIRFPGAPPPQPARAAAIEAALDLLHWMAGVSYYKAGAPPRLHSEAGRLDGASADLIRRVYTDGLAEFAFQNRLDLHARIELASDPATAERAAAPALGLRRRSLVPIGGGKDSLVTVELLRARDEPISAVYVGASPLIDQVIARTGLDALSIERRLSPRLFELNRAGAYNGHIPVTAINSAVLVLAALLHDFDAIVFSNERSASAPTLIDAGREVNHQWSKGFDFERRFGAWVSAHVTADLDYYSLLRPLSELAITRRFADLTRYHDVFSSCNRNFRILGPKPIDRWCGQCPKCHFVFLALAPFVPKPRLVQIFGRNLLDDPSQIAGFEALLEWHAAKPFECVGEAQESRAALAELTRRAPWREDQMVALYAEQIAPELGASVPSLVSLLAADGPSRIPARLAGIFDEAG